MSHGGDKKASTFWSDFFIGGTAGAISKTLVAPIERVKLLLQTQDANKALDNKKYTGIVNCFQRCVQEEGVLSLWRGNWANVVRYFPTTALNFAFKDTYGKIFIRHDSKTNPGMFFLGSLMSGGMAGATSLLFVYPLDFARTRLGVDIGKSAAERQFNGIMDCCFKIFKTDGLTGLYRGFGISVAGIFLYRSFYFGGYDAGKKWFFKDADKASFLLKFAFAQAITTFSEFISYPLDTIRRRLMMQSGRADVIYSGTMDCGRKIWHNEGIPAFWKGNLSNVFRSIGSSLVLVLFDEFKKLYLLKGKN